MFAASSDVTDRISRDMSLRRDTSSATTFRAVPERGRRTTNLREGERFARRRGALRGARAPCGKGGSTARCARFASAYRKRGRAPEPIRLRVGRSARLSPRKARRRGPRPHRSSTPTVFRPAIVRAGVRRRSPSTRAARRARPPHAQTVRYGRGSPHPERRC